ncbi:hypothetical protein SteCoe_16537 [Stentor coeruleus]|uniref:Uncharacterized protein n=1 Tax=Stentor coeruleus TaxID=5963 RepID=A0A1R2C117_9CILI|nr:hypothetical protein SteCoe_16537 [Stentor coeruleus]
MSKYNQPSGRKSLKLDFSTSKISQSNSPKPLKSPRYGYTEFFASLENQIKRLDPEFIFIWGDESPLTQALNCVKQAIDNVLNKSISTEVASLPRGVDTTTSLKNIKSDDPPTPESVKDMANDTEKVKYKLEKQAEKLKKEKEILRKNKNTLFEMEDELRRVKEELNNEYIMLNQNKNKLRNEKENFEREKYDMGKEKKMLLDLKVRLENKDNELKLAYDDLEIKRGIFAQERTEIDREKWLIDKEKQQNIEKLAIINQTREFIMQEVKSLEGERDQLLKFKVNLQKEASENKEMRSVLDHEKDTLAKLKENLIKEKQDEIVVYDLSKSPSFGPGARECVDTVEFVSKSEVDLMLAELTQSMQAMEDDLVQKAIELDDRETKIHLTESQLKEKAADLNLIKDSLERSSKELSELINVSLPRVNIESASLENIIKQLAQQKEALKQEQMNFDSLSYLKDDEKYAEIQKEIESRIYNIASREKKLEEIALEIEEHKNFLQKDEETVRNLRIEFKVEYENKIGEMEKAKAELEKLEEKIEAHFAKIEEKEKWILENIAQATR